MLRIGEILKRKNIANMELAQRLGVTPQYISDVVNGKKNITVQMSERIAQALDVPLASLFDGYELIEKQQSNQVECPHCGKTLKITTAKK